MGACDIVPGISGGTIAFITGIYDRLLSALGSLSSLDIKLIKKGKFKKFLQPLDLPFLIPLVLGILIAVVGVSKLILSLLQNSPSQVLSFFVGLILASSITLFSHVKKTSSQSYLFVFFGLLLGVLFSVLPIQPTSGDPSLFFVLVGGFFAITAMILPGVSGSFLLLVLGLYVSTLEALHSFNILYLVVFALGAMLSLLFVTKGIKKLLHTKKNQTMAALTGLVIGALLVPLKQITFGQSEVILVVVGIAFSFLLTHFAKK